MSMQARKFLVDPPLTIFSNSQRADFLNLQKTNTNLVAFLLELIGKGHIIQFTSVNSDHHDDRRLNPKPPYTGTHGGGYAVDCWPLASRKANDWLDARSLKFAKFLSDAAASPWLKQIGLAGTADNTINQIAAGKTWFPDDGANHVHLRVQ